MFASSCQAISHLCLTEIAPADMVLTVEHRQQSACLMHLRKAKKGSLAMLQGGVQWRCGLQSSTTGVEVSYLLQKLMLCAALVA